MSEIDSEYQKILEKQKASSVDADQLSESKGQLNSLAQER